MPHIEPKASKRPAWVPRLAAATVLCAAAAAFAGLSASDRHRAEAPAAGLDGAEPAAGQAAPPNDLGTDLPAPEASLPAPGADAAPGERHPVRLARGCVWSRPGSNPWRGEAAAALRAAGIPPGPAERILRQMRSQAPVAQVHFTAGGVFSDTGLVFAPRFTMTFAMTVCEDSRVGFGPEHVEPAALYAADGYYVAVPPVCGNVTRLILAGAARTAGPAARSLAPEMAWIGWSAPVASDASPGAAPAPAQPAGPGTAAAPVGAQAAAAAPTDAPTGSPGASGASATPPVGKSPASAADGLGAGAGAAAFVPAAVRASADAAGLLAGSGAAAAPASAAVSAPGAAPLQAPIGQPVPGGFPLALPPGFLQTSSVHEPAERTDAPQTAAQAGSTPSAPQPEAAQPVAAPGSVALLGISALAMAAANAARRRRADTGTSTSTSTGTGTG